MSTEIEKVINELNDQMMKRFDDMQQQQKIIATIGIKNVLTTEEVALYTGLSKAYIYKLVCYKNIPHYKSRGGKLTYFLKSEIDDWMAGRRVKTKDDIASEAANYAVNNPIKR